MLFSSVVFVLYFLPIVLIMYYAFAFSRTLQNILLLIASLIFYAWGEVKFAGLMCISIVVNTIFGYLVDKFRDNKRKSKFVVFLAVVYNLTVLFIFKYLMFAVTNINALFNTNFSVGKVILPLGISFYTFQAISYVVDVYRDDAKVEKNPIYVGLYIAFFPQLIAGPIVRYNSIAEQIKNRKSNFDKFSIGCCRFLVGFSKKILLSNNFAMVADKIFELTDSQVIPVSLAWLGAIAYTLQIYFDFSAYSDMAIGLAGMFGFRLEENFNYPYISKSIGEFWRRWHISLSTFFKEYVYFPLGGSRVENQDKMVRNTFIVWLLTGVWHGAEWTFIVWGLCNFIFILGERLFNFEKSKVPNSIKHIYTMFAVILGWVLFRAENLSKAFLYLKNMFGINSNGFASDTLLMYLKEYGVFFIAGIIFATPIAKRINKMNVERKMPVIGNIITLLYPIVIIGLFLISMTYLVAGSYNPFIYFYF